MLEWRWNNASNSRGNNIIWVLLFHIRLKNPLNGVVRRCVVKYIALKSHRERNEMESFFTQKMLAETCSFTIKGLIHKVFFVIFVNFWKRAIVKNDFLLESYHNLVKNLRWIFFLKKVRGKKFLPKCLKRFSKSS